MPTRNPRRPVQRALTGLVVASLVVSCSDDDDTTVEDLEEAGSGDLVAGQLVSIEGEVQEVFDESLFTMGRGRTLVFGAEDWDVRVGDEVTVVGEGVEFRVADVESALGVDLDDDEHLDHENEIAVEATDVVITDG